VSFDSFNKKSYYFFTKKLHRVKQGFTYVDIVEIKRHKETQGETMFMAIKKQVKDYQVWLDIASEIDLSPLRIINRFDSVTFAFVFFTMLFGYFLIIPFHPNLTLFALVLHILLGINILKARALVANSLDDIDTSKTLHSKVELFLNKQ